MREFVISETKQRRYSSESLAKDRTGLDGREIREERSFMVEKVDNKVGLNFEVHHSQRRPAGCRINWAKVPVERRQKVVLKLRRKE